jgi:hypothetical protein
MSGVLCEATKYLSIFCTWKFSVSGSKRLPHIGLYSVKRQTDRQEFFLLYVQVTMHRDNLRIKQLTRCVNIQTLFCHKNLHVSDISCAHHQELSIVHTAFGMFYAGYVTAS